ncbi:uncharacterized protein FIBRA_05491 [Fibroporia radiculosa]|uniref:RGS domain-containing protein n=1 Tax=Fibroporia radiculosa TaxID=599839 RepID=J4HXM0_9APHY|nr:uncharacterized protein FIBRA_05491 [Fibroporia radiculosa]CCM03362.1 predicted protein [Fibroporia radiculosa]
MSTVPFQRLKAMMIPKSPLSGITLANVLAGDTCYPISLRSFEAYLYHKEYSLENLQFVVWFQDYRRRFFELPSEIQKASPGPRQFRFALPTPARTAQRVAESERNALCHIGDTPATPSAHNSSFLYFSGTAGTESNYFPGSPRWRDDMPPALGMPLLCESANSTADRGARTPAEQPLRAECMRAVATFLRPGVTKELPLDPVVRDMVVRDLTWNTHPDTFLPVYEEIYTMLETVSLARFLNLASTNVNWPKKLYWYACGLTYTFVGLAIGLALIESLPAPPERSRAWRLFSVPFVTLGLMQIHSGIRGFCSDVFGRGHTQLREWELADMDEEAAAHWRRVLQPDDANCASSRNRGEGDEVEMVRMSQRAPWDAGDDVNTEAVAMDAGTDIPAVYIGPAQPAIDAVVPFVESPVESTLASSIGSSSRDARQRHDTLSTQHPHLRTHIWSRKVYRKHSEDDILKNSNEHDSPTIRRRPPVFGPERAVLDPRIQAAHARVLREMLYVGLWCGIVSNTFTPT